MATETTIETDRIGHGEIKILMDRPDVTGTVIRHRNQWLQTQCVEGADGGFEIKLTVYRDKTDIISAANRVRSALIAAGFEVA